jgi:hypothetical protein
MLLRGTSDQYGLHINIVVIGELLWRDPMRVHSEYNKNVTDTNSALYNMIQHDSNRCDTTNNILGTSWFLERLFSYLP